MSLLLAFALAAPPAPILDDVGLSTDAQWAAITACPRVTGGSIGGSIGTAVCIGRRDGFAYILTASHTMPEGEARSIEFFSKESYPKPSRSFFTSEVVVRLTEADVALVKVPIEKEIVSVLRLAGSGERPKRFPFICLAIGCPESAAPRCRSERIVGKPLVRRPNGSVAFYWQAAQAPVGGMSGGPLLDERGRVIGICSAAQHGLGYFGHLDEIHYGLKAKGFSWLFEGGAEKAGAKD